ncbi:unnamed protein product, partial [Chrysoparadoxa australica]
PYLGGAERSFILQASDLVKQDSFYEVSFYIPFFKNPDDGIEIKKFLEQLGFRSSQIFYYQYSPLLYQLSRKSGLGTVVWAFQAIWGLLSTLRNLSHLQISSPDIWWVGGNKVGFVIFVLGYFLSFKGRVLWHFRDYPYRRGLFKIIWKLFKMPHSMRLEAIGNSKDVTHAIKKGGGFKKVSTLYNPVGDLRFSSRESMPLKLGTASMFAPWKGIHSLCLFALLYEKELKALGFEKFYIYGDEIYKTKGNHRGYKKALRELQKKFNSNFLSFEGLKSPNEIFPELDIFIHGSLEKEPFGRVLVEAYKGGALLITTGLGGAGELIQDGETGFVFKPHHYSELLKYIEKATRDDRQSIIQKGVYKADAIANEYQSQMKEIFSLS